jgi:uncharacterized Zn-finger protein
MRADAETASQQPRFPRQINPIIVFSNHIEKTRSFREVVEIRSNQSSPRKLSSGLNASVHNHSASSFSCQMCGTCFPSSHSLSMHICSQATASIGSSSPAIGRAKSSFEESFDFQGTSSNPSFNSSTSAIISNAHPASSQEFLVKDVTTSRRSSSSSNSSSIICEACGKEFAYRSAYLSHVVVHTGERKFKCTICESSFAHKSTLKVHMRTHTQDKPFKCEICEMTFPHKTSLNRHRRTHTGEKPFSCQICARAFRDQSTLARHVRTHTGDKPFSCPSCDKTFSQKSHLNRHFASKHDKTAENDS